MRHVPTIEDVRRAIRARVCPHCPNRSLTEDSGPGHERQCESKCPLFLHLPVLRETARLSDPMICRRPQVIEQLVRELSRRRRVRSTKPHIQRVVGVFEEMFR